jgi:rRNA biogenesis protein RRP5
VVRKLTFSQISHVSDERIPALSSTTGQFRAGTLHRARVIGHSPLDGMMLLSFEQKVLDQVFMQVHELQVGQVLKVNSLVSSCSRVLVH